MENNNQVASFETGDESRFVDQRRSNVKSDLIEITEDKLENILLKHLKKMGTRNTWLAPFGVFISVVLTIVSATFNAKFGIPASTWEAVFIIAAIVSGVWFCVSVIVMIISWKESSTDFLIARIKNSDTEKDL